MWRYEIVRYNNRYLQICGYSDSDALDVCMYKTEEADDMSIRVKKSSAAASIHWRIALSEPGPCLWDPKMLLVCVARNTLYYFWWQSSKSNVCFIDSFFDSSDNWIGVSWIMDSFFSIWESMGCDSCKRFARRVAHRNTRSRREGLWSYQYARSKVGVVWVVNVLYPCFVPQKPVEVRHHLRKLKKLESGTVC